jgi:DNA helicase-2/ATP-dependent DNA helicase PcrA
MLRDGALGGIIHSAEESGFVTLVSKDPSFVHVWKGIVTLAESLSRDGDMNNPTELMEAMLKYRQSAESKTVKVSVGAPDFPVKAMTAHGSKGLEFDYVFIPYANEETWVGRAHGSSFILPAKKSSDHDIRDMRRLFYVAITRARKHAIILYSTEESDGKMLTPLRFVSELHKDHVLETRLPRASVSLQDTKNSSHIENESDKLMVSEAKKILLDSGLSVTALNHFLECPSKFLYESILKMPQAPSLSAEKGSAMHEALSRVWMQKDRSSQNVESVIVSTVAEYIDKSLLSQNDKTSLKNELIENAKLVASALATHFGSIGLISTERWFETPFDTKYNDKNFSVPIHGKLDTVIDGGDIVSVFDYKTKQGMSVSAIKGETKTGDSNYFRQLIFYKMLLDGKSEWLTRTINTSLVFVSPDEKGRCPIVTIPVTEDDIKRVKGEIQSLIDSIWSGKITTEYCGDLNCQYCSYRKLLK